MRTLFIDHFLHIVSRNYYFIGTFLAARFGMDVQMIVIEDYHKLLDALATPFLRRHKTAKAYACSYSLTPSINHVPLVGLPSK